MIISPMHSKERRILKKWAWEIICYNEKNRRIFYKEEI